MSRTPHGVRGLKSQLIILPSVGRVSHPSRGAWIEIRRQWRKRMCCMSHPVRGAWIEIPEGRRFLCCGKSHPSRGAWIEITPTRRTIGVTASSHPSRGAWIEMICEYLCNFIVWSHPSRGAWIEIAWSCSAHRTCASRTPHGVRGLK